MWSYSDKSIPQCCCLSTLFAYFCVIAGCSTESSIDQHPVHPQFFSGVPNDKPFTLTLHRPKRLDLPKDEIKKIRRLSHPLENGMTASLILHVLHAHGLEAEFDNPKLHTGADLLKLFTDDQRSRTFFGEPAVIRSRYGIRCAVSPNEIGAREHHRDQALGIFAEMGLPLTTSIHVAGNEYHLRDLLIDSIANYGSNQNEIEWTAFSYALYLPPVTSWKNKFGDQFTFDDMAEAIIARPLDKGSCSGSHLVWAMIALIRVDKEESPILSPSVHEKLWARLQEIVRVALEKQNGDGSWGSDWNLPLLPPTHVDEGSLDYHALQPKLVATSHIAEWMMHLPKELTVPDEVIHRAGAWLYRQWQNLSDKTFVAENFCPCSHAAVVLGALCGKE